MNKAGYQKLFEDKVLGPWLKEIGIEMTSRRNCVNLPTMYGKLLKVMGSNRSMHLGRHLKSYFDRVDELIWSIYQRNKAGTLSNEAAKAEIEAIQNMLKQELKAGRIKLQNEADLLTKYGDSFAAALLVTSLSKEELDAMSERIAARFIENLNLRLATHPGNLVRAGTYCGKGYDFWGWLGWGVDLVNPGDDLATIFDLVEILDTVFDPESTLNWRRGGDMYLPPDPEMLE